tara:strand:- start:730 stop:960 length:231 start_codon:yes stop_codon:yes gene_type:complete
MYMTPGKSGIANRSQPVKQPEPAPKRKIRGLGDVVHWVTSKFGIEFTVKKITKGKDCGCAARREALNRAVPFGKDD